MRTNKHYPVVTIIIPCLNEEKFIGQCLESIASQDYPKDRLEVLVVDGNSKDRTKEILVQLSNKFPYLKILDNPDKFTPISMNIGIKAAKGEIIVRMDAHAKYKEDYIARCIAGLDKYGAANIGGRLITLPARDTLMAKAICLSISNIAGSAGAVYKTAFVKGVRKVDTVFCGCYKKDIFEKIGYFNERLRRTQDLEFNIRLAKSGGKIIYDPSIIARYYPKPTLKEFFFYNLGCGEWVFYSWKIAGHPLKVRQYVPFCFVLGMFSIFILKWQVGLFLFSIYISLLLLFSFNIAIREKDWRLVLPLISAFVSRHIGYGLGSFLGLLMIILHPSKKDF
jgi:glycosyltransferase involved in cell wall biosynthesis